MTGLAASRKESIILAGNGPSCNQLSAGGRIFGHNGAYRTEIRADIRRDSVGVILTQPFKQAQPFLRDLRDRIERVVQRS